MLAETPKSSYNVFMRIFKADLIKFGLVLFLGFGLIFPAGIKSLSAQELNPEERAEVEKKIELLENEAVTLDSQISQLQGASRTLANEIKLADAQVKKKEAEISRINLALKQATSEIGAKERGIAVTSQRISKNQRVLAASLSLLYIYDQSNTLVTFLKNKNLSDFFRVFTDLETTQENLENKLSKYREDRSILRGEKEDLESYKKEQQDLKALQEVERRFLAQKKAEKDELLKLTKGKETIFQQLLKSKRKDIASLRAQLFYLEKTGVTAEDAVKFAELAAQRAGIRTAFLLALLEVETGKQFEDGVISAGSNVGTGNWKKDMYDCYRNAGKASRAEAEKKAFMDIVNGLGLDPDKMPVSRRPSYGCGGAMGAAQFLPSTWLQYADRVSALTGHEHPNPWNVEDAFTAAAILLAQAGADSRTPDGEARAAKVYISGNPSCTRSICNWYSRQILSLTKDIDRIL